LKFGNANAEMQTRGHRIAECSFANFFLNFAPISRNKISSTEKTFLMLHFLSAFIVQAVYRAAIVIVCLFFSFYIMFRSFIGNLAISARTRSQSYNTSGLQKLQDNLNE